MRWGTFSRATKDENLYVLVGLALLQDMVLKMSTLYSDPHELELTLVKGSSLQVGARRKSGEPALLCTLSTAPL